MMMLQISEHCSAGCRHCPFTSNARWKSVAEILQESRQMTGPYLTLTGGEPLEHPHFLEIVETLHKRGIPFRVATGGHIPLSKLSSILCAYPEFLGFNLGTDVVSDRNGSSVLKEVWKDNLRFLKSVSIPWSLTFTLGSDFNALAVVDQLKSDNILPYFLMLNTLGQDDTMITHFQQQLSVHRDWSELVCL